MISQNKQKLLRLLEQKKRRDAEGLFVAEGRKTVTDLIRGGMQCTYLAATPERLAELREVCGTRLSHTEQTEATSDEIAEVSSLQTRSEVLAIMRKPNQEAHLPAEGLTLMLDEVQDPGNMGTIVRTADWFGIHNIVCSRTSADAYGPKAVQACMGALARVRVTYADLAKMLDENAKSAKPLPVYGTFLEGANVYATPLSQNGVILMGNEGRGISAALAPFVSQKLFIPNYPAGEPTSESLNVSTATAVICAEFRRRTM